MTETHQSLTSFAFCWQLERSDGAGLALTSHDHELTIGDTVFQPGCGLLPAAIRRGELDEPAAEAEGALSTNGLSREDLLSGRWDRAGYRLIATEWACSSATCEELASGELGNVALNGSSFQADLLAPAIKLDRDVCPKTSPECRATFGDKQCRVDLAGRRLRAKVVSGASNEIHTDVSSADRFAQGEVRWLGGRNSGLKGFIVGVRGSVLHLRESPAFPVFGGEDIELTEGCDKRVQTCGDRFTNVVNFRGEPHVPGNDLLTRYPGG